MSPVLRTAGLGLTTLAVITALAGCGSSGAGDAQGTPAGQASPEGHAAHRAKVTVTAAHGCTLDHTSFGAGGITFDVKNVDATAVTEVEVLDGGRIIGEKENIPPGFSGTFSVSVDAGTYHLYCPGAGREKQPITVTGKAADTTDESTAALLKQATRGYAKYVDTQVGYLLAGVKKLDRTLHGHDLGAARAAYADARKFYEKIEPVAESFTVGKKSLDAKIDARANDVPAGQFQGFHRIEKGLWADDSLAGLQRYGDGLVSNVQKLEQLTSKLTYQPTELANGAQGLLDEVAATKITGEEERYSHMDLLDIAANVEGSRQAFAALEPALERMDSALAHQIEERFEALDKLVETYRDPSQPSGYETYTALGAKDKHQLAAAVTAVQEPLSRVASKVARA